MARKTAIINKNQERAVIIGAGITEDGISPVCSLFMT